MGEVIRSVLAVAAGFVVVVIGMLAAFIAIGLVASEAYMTTGVQGAILLSALVSSLLGGHVAAALARTAAAKHGRAVGITTAIIGPYGLISLLFFTASDEPFWLQVTLMLVPVPAAWAGGWLRGWLVARRPR